MTEKTIILGSASPRRRELLAQIGAEFEVRVSNKEEVYHSNVPEEIVKELALMKAENVAEELAEENPAGAVKSTVVIGADTIVVQDGKILGKPADEADAVRMLTGLQGRRHDVAVYVNEMTEEEIRAYVETKDPLDKAGAYGIQGRFAAHIDRIEGDYYNVVGLPVSRVYRTLRKLGVL